ncbi:NodT family efflux transporter outer membrane factor (OMF) lipoprotein [Actimicrobium sp. GrIS 1.19]|uniref:efflux transporter outer membrane subunit n=1 Tax=Actimicrobium sp. GrIS 1.19 TaxID=3071708 RepID=UPI002E0C590B|nr:NodT family efflux transporter outer membrane factor (OMF) lipoprotein [Actimicrobium sp. GrIS 1.19]
MPDQSNLSSMKTLRSAIPGAVLLALAISGCVSHGDIRSTTTTTSATDLASTVTLPGQGGRWPRVDWPGQIGGPALQALVDEALADNPNLKASSARIAAAQALAEATRAAAGPTVGGSFTSTYQRYTEHGIIPPPLAGAVRSDNQLAVSFAYDLDFWGKHAADLRAVLAQGKAIDAEQYSARLMLAAAVAHGWLGLHRQLQQLDLIEQQQAVRIKQDDLTRRRIAAGLDTQSENQLGKIQLANLRAEHAQWQEAAALTRNQLAALLGKGPDRGLAIARPSTAALEDFPLPEALPLELLARRPDVLAARWQVEAMQGDIDSARTNFYPNVNLTAFVGSSSLGLGNLLNSGSRIAGIGPAIHLPIFEGGALRAQLKGKVAGYDGAVATYNAALTEALHDVSDQVQSMRSAAVQSKQQHAAAEAANSAWQLAAQRQRVGTTNLLPVLAAEANLLQQRRSELDAQLRMTDLRVGLIKSLGGGFDANAAGLTAPPAAAAESLPTSRNTTVKATS